MNQLWESGKGVDEILSEVCQRLIESISRKIAAVIKANGGHTKC